ncbi:MAG: histone deacetylase [Acidobacteria bacterium]|nr:histone deacetylase [Acidobacteriota bacterium]
MPRTALVYHDGYDLNFGDHVFPSIKYRLIRQKLISLGFATPDCFHSPEPASDEDLLLVHTPEWIQKLKQGTLSYTELLRLEVPYSQQMARAFWLAAGGTILAAQLALGHGAGYNTGGGFHHAFPGHGEGFCAIHDVAVAIRKLQKEGLIRRAMVVDCDVHHGNGTAGIFAGDASVFTLSIHQFRNYPSEKPPSTIDIHLPDGAGDEEYLAKLRNACQVAVPGFRPDMMFYVAGADPYIEDQLGGLNISIDGLKERDRVVIEIALRHKVPVVITLAGGYAREVEDTVMIHANTALIAEDVLGDIGFP